MSSSDNSEQLDGDVLGELPGDVDRPGVGDYPPDRPLGVEDPSLFDDDDLGMRADLRRAIESDPGTDVILLDPWPIDGTDHDETMFGEGEPPHPRDDISAEEAAVHIIPAEDVPTPDDTERPV